jgi:hypothetical protein
MSRERSEAGMPRAIDFHVHLPISEFMEVAIGQFREATERYFRSEVKLRDIEEIADYYGEHDIVGVLLAWDAETATGRKPLPLRPCPTLNPSAPVATEAAFSSCASPGASGASTSMS